MSSSNLVRLTYMKEAAYGVKPSPLSGVTLNTARFTSESLSGTPATTESQELRVDRMSAGQVVTGLDVGGGIDFELAPDQFFDDYFEGAMMNEWTAAVTVNATVDLVPNPANDQEAELTLGSAFASLYPGAILKLEPSGADPVIVSVISIDTPDTVFTVATMRGEAEITSETMDVSLPPYLDIGAQQISFLNVKTYDDVLDGAGPAAHGQTYLGELVSGFSLTAQYGSIVTGSFATLGNGYLQESPSFDQQVVTAGGTVVPAGTTNQLNASIDVPLVASGGESTTFCIESFTIEMDNGLSARNCIGKQAPTGYDLGTATINISASIYNSESSYEAFMPAKLSQAPVSLTFVMQNMEGGYAYHLPAVQLSFPDPAATGRDQSTMLEASGVAKVGSSDITSALRIYKLHD